MNKLNKIITSLLMVVLFFSCSKDEEKVSIIGVWKISKIEHKECKKASDNDIITFDNGCIKLPSENLNSCWELRFEDKKSTSVWTEKDLSTGAIDGYSEENYYKLDKNNTTLTFCSDETLVDCDVDEVTKIELKEKTLILHFSEGFDVDCYSILTFVRE